MSSVFTVPEPVTVYVRVFTVGLRLVIVMVPSNDPDVLSKMPVPLVMLPENGKEAEPAAALPGKVPVKESPLAIVNVAVTVAAPPL